MQEQETKIARIVKLIYAIGDIHGQHTMLLEMIKILREIPIQEDDVLVFLGDYVDRGENSKAVIETLIQLKEERPGTIFLRGNHEQLMIEAKDGPLPEASEQEGYIMYSSLMINWLQNGGVDTLLNYGVVDFAKWWEEIPPSHWDFIRDTQLEYITERYCFVHAGLLPQGKSWEGQEWEMKADPRMWIREPFLSSRDRFEGRIVVFGHTPQRSGRPLINKNKIGIDTGAVFGGPLTAAAFSLKPVGNRMPTPEFFQVRYSRLEPQPSAVE